MDKGKPAEKSEAAETKEYIVEEIACADNDIGDRDVLTCGDYNL